MRNTRLIAILSALPLGAIPSPGCAVEAIEEEGVSLPELPVLTEAEEVSECDVQFGRTYILDKFELMPPGQGFDLDGDGDIDNTLGFLGSVANNGFRQAIAAGAAIYLLDLTPWMDSLATPPSGPGLAFFHGVDADADPSNNTSGSGEFVVAAEQFDVSCHPTSAFHGVLLVNSTLRGHRDDWSFFMPEVGTLDFVDFQVEIELVEDLSRISARAAAVWPMCSLHQAPFPGPDTRSMLDIMVVGFQVPADIDFDGDGLEQVMGDGERVSGCIDGDGTEIPGHYCACDPRIADGYSVAFQATGVPAQIVGVLATAP
jgi:hypothetical protein